MIGGALVGVLIEALILRRLIGEPPFTLIMVTIGILFVLDNLVTAIWGPEDHNLARSVGQPHGRVRRRQPGHRRHVDDRRDRRRHRWLLRLLPLLDARAAMRATAADQEAAMARASPPGASTRCRGPSPEPWRALAGVMLAVRSRVARPGSGSIALVAFPAMILGGLESPGGAVIGGLIIGLVQQLTALLQPEYFEWLGAGFERVSPYVVMVIILLVRPFGLYGEPEVRRV